LGIIPAAPNSVGSVHQQKSPRESVIVFLASSSTQVTFPLFCFGESLVLVDMMALLLDLLDKIANPAEAIKVNIRYDILLVVGKYEIS
jgi:hypothetical protein